MPFFALDLLPFCYQSELIIIKLNVFTVGRCLIMTPKTLLRRSLAKKLQKEMKAKKITLNDLLKDLKAERKLYNK